MMKKSVRLFALVLVCALLMSFVTIAHADGCYEMIKFFYEYDDEEMLVSLGQGMVFPAEPENNVVLFVVDVPAAHVFVTGLNAESQPEGYVWYDVQEMEAMMAFVQLCTCYEQLAAELTECDQLVGGIILAEGEDPYLITSAEEAQTFVELFSSLMAEE